MRTLLFPAAFSLTLPLLAQLGPEHRFIYPSTGTALAVHDMDGDGDGDVLRATAAGLLLSEQIAPGEFSVTRVLAPASGALRLGFGDLDGDGIDDVLIPDATGSTITWMRVLGGGDYGTPATAVDGLSGPLQATAADVDGDGDQDLLLADDNAGTLVIAWAENQGGGLFAAPITISTSGLPSGAQLQVMLFDHGDIDGDGDEDLVSLYPTPQWYRNDGAGNFTGEPLTSVSTAGDLVLADIDGDGDLDLWIVHGPGEIRKTLNNGDGSFAPEQVAYQEGNYLIHSLSVGDRDGDGDPDLFGTDTNIGWPVEVFVLLNDGTGTLASGGHFGYSDDSYQPYALGAIDTDAVQDVVAFTNDVTTVFLSAGGGTFPISSVQQPRQLTVIGRDVVVSGPQSWGPTHRGNRPLQAARHTNGGTGLRQQPIPLWVSASPIERTDTADLNGDGITDLVLQWQEPLSNTMRRSFWMDGTDSVSAIGNLFFSSADPYPTAPRIADLDNDGDNDVARIFQGILTVMLNDGSGAFGAPQEHPLFIQTQVYGLCLGDMSGDGVPDYLWTQWPQPGVDGPDSLIWATNDGTSVPATRQAIAMPIRNAPVSGTGGLRSPLIECYDLDGDNVQEIILFNGDSLAVMKDISGTWSPEQLLSCRAGNYAVADLDGDGAQDLVFVRLDGMITARLGIGGAQFGDELILMAAYPGTTGLALADMDGDGDPDVLTCSPNGHAAWMENLFSTGYRAEVHVWHDANADGVPDAGEGPLPFISISCTPGLAMPLTDASGHFTLALPGGDLTLASHAPDALWTLTTSPSEYTIHLDDTTPISTGNDFGYVANGAVTDVEPTLVGSLSACNGHAYFFVGATNLGNTMPDGTITLVLDTALTYDGAFPAPASINGDTLRWTFQDLYYYSSVPSIQVYLLGVDVSLIGGTISLLCTVDATDASSGTEDHASTTWQSVVTCAYDPNFKEVAPRGYTENGYIPLDTDHLDYTIHFQNTGNATATDVVLHDQLDPALDPASLTVLGYSHEPTEAGLDAAGRLAFRFEGIALPDSASDMAGSQGFITFRLRLADGVADGTTISNTASILFDTNPPVVTNTTLNTLVDCGLYSVSITSISDLVLEASAGVAYQWYLDGWPIFGATGPVLNAEGEGAYSVEATSATGCTAMSEAYVILPTGMSGTATAAFLAAPNPVTTVLRILAPEALQPADVITLSDVSGRVLRTMRGTGAREILLERGAWANGTYLVRIARVGRPPETLRVVMR